MPENEWRLQLEKLPYPTERCDGKTIIVVGANIGLGLEAARHFVRLGAAKTILGVREKAQKSIEESEHRPGSTEVWEIDLGNYKSTLAFAERVKTLERVDAIVMNASVAMPEFVMLEDNEANVTVNAISTFLLVVAVLPKLREIAVKKLPSILAADRKAYKMTDRYHTSKLLQVLAVRELAAQTKTEPKITIKAINPGLANTALTRHATGTIKYAMATMKFFLARTAEEASRTLVHAALIGPETTGQYISNCDASRKTLSKFVLSEEGWRTQKKLWSELITKYESIQSGIMANL